MKKLLILALVTLSINARAQWVAQNSGTTNTLMSIHFPTIAVGYSLAVPGYLYKTINGGTNWNQVGVHNDMWGQVFFTSIDTGYATGARGVLKTVNGGVSWIHNFTDSVFTTSVYFPTVNIGYLIGTNQTGDTALIYKTVNAGNTWSKIATQYCAIATSIQSIYFINATTGFIVLYGNGIYKTTNGGLNWIVKSTVMDLYNVQFPSTSIGYAVGDNDLLKSNDGGETWNTLTNNNPQPLACVFFTDNNTGYIGGGNLGSGAIEKTINGGATWTVDLPNVQNFSSIYFPDANTGYTCGSNGIIYKLNTTVRIDEAMQDNEINIYPNPCSTQLEINNSGLVIKEVKIYNVVGEEILKQVQNDKSATIDVSKLSKGIYFIQLQNTTQSICKKFVKQ